MAVVIFQDGEKRELAPAIALKIWEVLTGVSEPSGEQQIAFCNRVKRLYLNWRTAPEAYIRDHWETIVPLMLSGWRVNRQGQPIMPDSESDWTLSRAWGLYEHGRLNNTVLTYGPKQ